MATQGNENALKYVILFPHDVTAAILVFQSNETAAMLVFQTSPVEVELFSYVKHFFCFADHVSENALYSLVF